MVREVKVMRPRTAGTPGSDDKSMATEERVRQRAYDIFLSRGDGPGSAEEDWYLAEVEIHNEMEQKQAISPKWRQ
jgi:hypothetical protein